MKSKSRIKGIALMLMLSILVFSSFFQVAHSQTVPIGKTVQSNPFESNPTANAASGVVVTSPADAYDGSFSSVAYFKYSATGFFELKSFNITGAQFADIGWVDFKISYSAMEGADDRYRIVYYVGTSGPVILQDWVNGTESLFDGQGNQAHRAWANQPKAGGGSWSWTDINNVRVVFETEMVGSSDGNRYVFVYEVWLTVYEGSFPAETEPSMSVQPPDVRGINPGETFFVDVYIVNVDLAWGYQYVLFYDPSILTALDVFSYHPFNYPVFSIINETGGYVAVSISSFFGDPVGLTGNSPMTRIYFQVDAAGTSTLEISNPRLVDVFAKAILVSHVDGLFSSVTLSHDIAISDVTASPTTVIQGENVTIDVTVENQGNFSETFDVTVYFATTAIEPNQTVSSMAAGTTQVLTFSWNTTGVAEDMYTISAIATTVPEETDTTDNAFLDGTVTVTTLNHDVAVTDVNASPTTVNPGESVTIDVTVENQGDFPETFDVTVYYDSTAIGPAQTVTSMAAGTTQVLTFDWDTIGVAEDTYTIKAQASTVPEETDTTDNTFTDGTVTVTIVTINHDIAVTDVNASPTLVVQGESVTIEVTVENQGDVSETFDITVYRNNVFIDTQTVTNLGAGTSTIVTFSWDTSGVAEDAYEIKAVASAVPSETDTSDNTFIDGTVTVLLTLPPSISITPTSGPTGTKVEVTGDRFGPNEYVILSFDDMLIAEAFSDDQGDFTAVFNVPLSEAGAHIIKARFGSFFVEATFTVIDTSPLDINMEVGQIHFRGELAEFYIQTVFKGAPIDVTSIEATLRKPDGTTQTLTVQHVTTGLYKAPYTIPTNAPVGTYVLVVEADYLTGTINSKGTSIKGFLLSLTLTNWNAWLIEIKGDVATVKTDISEVKLSLSSINAKIVAINGTVATIQTDVGLINTKLDVIDATLTSIEDTTATINSALGLIQTDIDDINLIVSEIDGTVVTIQTDLGTISGKITTMQGDVATIETDVGTIKTTLQGWMGATTSIITPTGTFKLLALTTSHLDSLTSAENTITIVVSGSTDSDGTTNFVIPKQLLTSIESTLDKIAATINDQQVDFVINETPETYVLSIQYTHSTKTIKVFLAGIPPQPLLPLSTILLIIFAIGIITAAIVLYIKRLRKQTINP